MVAQRGCLEDQLDFSLRNSSPCVDVFSSSRLASLTELRVTALVGFDAFDLVEVHELNRELDIPYTRK